MRPLPCFVVSLVCFATVCGAAHATPALANVYARTSTSLNGTWHYIVDPYENGYYDYRHQPFDAAAKPTAGYFLDRQPVDRTVLQEYDFATSPTLSVPGDWNSQDPRLLYYEGSIWYERHFDAPRHAADHRLFVYFGAANYRADVYVNGHKLGTHLGGFTPFWYEVTSLVRDHDNSLVVKVDNKRHVEAVPTLNTDWWNYGGITRDVLLVETPATYIADFRVQLQKGHADRVGVTVALDGARPAQTVQIAIDDAAPALELHTGPDGRASGEFSAANLALWSPDHPVLHRVTLAAETDRTTDRIGFRTVEVRGADILVNGRPVFLRGISIHEEVPMRGGRAYSKEDARLLLGWAKELNCNFARLAHYPHNEFMARVADELGILLWEEVPVYWTIQWENPDTLRNAQAQLSDLIARDGNRASVIVWSVANETPVGDARTRFLRTLVDTARAADNTRLVSAAMEVRPDPADADHKIVDDPFGQYTDLLSFNEYIGWYDGLPDKIDRIHWTIKYDKPVVISEFGAGALQGWHADPLTRFSEEYQADVYRRTLTMLAKIPQWRGCTPWILCDFRSPRRLLANVQDGWNRKGLIGENGTRKEAFFTLQKFYGEKARQAHSSSEAAK